MVARQTSTTFENGVPCSLMFLSIRGCISLLLRLSEGSGFESRSGCFLHADLIDI